MKQIYIIGPDIKTDKNYIKDLYSKNGHEVKVIGDGINPVDINDYKLDRATDIIINAHGFKIPDFYAIDLYSSEIAINNLCLTFSMFSDIARSTIITQLY